MANLQFSPLDQKGLSQQPRFWLPSVLREQEFNLEYDFGWVARLDSKTLGFCWGAEYRYQGEKRSFLKWVYVQDPYRCNQVATELIRRTEQDALDRGHIQISASIEQNHHKPATFRILQRNGWEQPYLFSYCYRMTITGFFENAPWAHPVREYPYQKYIFPWAELSAKERKSLEDEEGPDSWKEDSSQVSPLTFDLNFEPHTSLGMRIDNQVVAWNINQMYGVDALLYGSFFVRKQYRRSGLAIPLLLESFRRQRALGIPDCIWFTQETNKGAILLHDKMFSSCLLSRTPVYQAAKQLLQKSI